MRNSRANPNGKIKCSLVCSTTRRSVSSVFAVRVCLQAKSLNTEATIVLLLAVARSAASRVTCSASLSPIATNRDTPRILRIAASSDPAYAALKYNWPRRYHLAPLLTSIHLRRKSSLLRNRPRRKPNPVARQPLRKCSARPFPLRTSRVVQGLMRLRGPSMRN